MKYRRLVVWIVSLVSLLAPGVATAGIEGHNLSWDECGAAGVENKLFACDTNVGSSELVVSFIVPQDMPLFQGAFVWLTAEAAPQQTLPDWWAFHACRSGTISADATFANLSACADPYVGEGFTSAITFTPDYAGPHTIRIAVAATHNDQDSLFAGVEYYAARFTILYDKSTGPGACPGCSTGMMIAVDRIIIRQLAQPDYETRGPAARGHVLWQGGVVPTLSRSWGQVKSLYR